MIGRRWSPRTATGQPQSSGTEHLSEPTDYERAARNHVIAHLRAVAVHQPTQDPVAIGTVVCPPGAQNKKYQPDIERLPCGTDGRRVGRTAVVPPFSKEADNMLILIVALPRRSTWEPTGVCSVHARPVASFFGPAPEPAAAPPLCCRKAARTDHGDVDRGGSGGLQFSPLYPMSGHGGPHLARTVGAQSLVNVVHQHFGQTVVCSGNAGTKFCFGSAT